MPEPSYFYQHSEINVKPFNEYGHDELKVNKQNSFKASSFAMNVKPKLMSQKNGVLLNESTPTKDYKNKPI